MKSTGFNRLFIISIFIFFSCNREKPSLGETPWQLPTTWEKSNNAQKQQWAYYDFIWKSFVAVNWPNVPIQISGDKIIKGYRGEPIADKEVIYQQSGNGDLPFISVWETYKQPGEVFPKDSLKSPYPDWNTPPPFPSTVPGEFNRSFGGFFGNFVEYATDLNQPDFFPNPTGPLMDQDSNYVRYEVTINEAFFTYIKHFKYFDASMQIKAVNAFLQDPTKTDEGFQRPPHGTQEQLSTGYLRDLPTFARQGMIDLKAAWRVLDPSKGQFPERYLHRMIDIDRDGDKELMGLVALHILRFTPDGQVACTFEHVDNVRVGRNAPEGLKPTFNTGAAPNSLQRRLGFAGKIPNTILHDSLIPRDERKPVSIYRVTPLNAELEKINNEYQDLLKGTVFEFYELIGTQNKHPGNPPRIIFKDSTARALNGHEGPTTGVYSNTNNLINAALESYTQTNHSC